jgi:hypothetical protein
MTKTITAIGCVCLVFFVGSCQRKIKPDDYIRYVNDTKNGLRKVIKLDGWEFCMLYRPYNYIMLMENKGNGDNYNVVKRKSELEGTAWFTITLKRMDNSVTPLRYGISSIDEYNVRLNYFLNEASKDIRLLYDKDTLRPVSYLFENNYNLAPQETMIVGFYLPEGKNNPQQNMRLSFVDKIFKTGTIDAEFSKETLKNIPDIVY